MKTLSQTAQTRFQSNENLLRVMIQYLSVKDIASLSQVSKFFHKATRHFDFQFKGVGHEFFCSQYENYSLENQLNESIILSSNNSVKGGSDQEEIVINIQSPSLSQFTWKQLLNLGMNIKQSWLSNPHQEEFINDLTLVSQYIYSNLKECEILPRLRKQNHIIEGDFNSSLQTYLFDYIYEQQNLYEEYNPKMAEFNSNNKPIQCRNPEMPFCDFINKFQKLKDSITTPDKIDVLNQLRWYMCFNNENNIMIKKDNSLRQKIMIDWQMNNDNNFFCNNSSDNGEEDFDSIFDSIVLEKERENNISNMNTNTNTTTSTIKEREDIMLNNDIINKQLQQETNPLFFVVKCIYFTITFYCQYSMNYINSTFTKDTDILGEYVKIYKNYIDTAIGMNEYCENINVAINYCYEALCKDNPSTPKFSILRLFVIIWNKELSKQFGNHQSMLTKVKQSIISLYTNSINEFSDLLKHKAKEDMNSNSKFKDNYDDISIGESFSTKYSFNINESYNQLFAMSNDEGSESGLKIEDSLANNLIEQGLGIISDAFCDEYNVFSLNSSQLKVNQHFNEIEDQMIDKVESMITSVYEHNKKREESSWIKILIDDIIKYFSSCFYSSKILTQFKLRFYDRIHSCLKEKIAADLIDDFTNYIVNKKITITKEFKAKTYFKLHPNTLKAESIYQTLFNAIAIQSIPELVKEYCVVRYIIETGKSQGSILCGLKQLKDWISEEQEKSFYKNKQIEKELMRKNIQCNFSRYEQEMLSMSWIPNLEIVGKAKKMLKLKKAHSSSSHGKSLMTSYEHDLDRDDLALALELV